jgi:hypothetical protein
MITGNTLLFSKAKFCTIVQISSVYPRLPVTPLNPALLDGSIAEHPWHLVTPLIPVPNLRMFGRFFCTLSVNEIPHVKDKIVNICDSYKMLVII